MFVARARAPVALMLLLLVAAIASLAPLASCQEVWFSPTSSKDWTSVSLDDCKSDDPCMMGGGSHSINQGYTFIMKAGNYSSTSNPMVGTIQITGGTTGFNIIFTGDPSFIPSDPASSVQGISWTVVGYPLSASPVLPLSSVALGPGYFSGTEFLLLEGITQVSITQSTFVSSNVNISGAMSTVVSDSHWTSSLANIPLSLLVNTSSASMSISRSSFDCLEAQMTSTASCNAPLWIYSAAPNATLTITAEDSQSFNSAAFSWKPALGYPVTYNLNVSYEISNSNITTYGATSAAYGVFACWDATETTITTIGATVIVFNSTILHLGTAFQPFSLALISLTLNTATLSQIDIMLAKTIIVSSSTLIDSPVTLRAVEKAVFLDSNFLMTSLLGDGSLRALDTTLMISNCSFLDVVVGGRQSNLILSNSTLLDPQPGLGRSPSLVASNICFGNGSVILGSVEVGSSMAACSFLYLGTSGSIPLYFVSVTTSIDYLVSWSPSSNTSNDMLKFNNSVTFKNIAFQGMTLMQYQITSTTIPNGASVVNSQYPLWYTPTEVPAIAFTWKDSVTLLTNQPTPFLHADLTSAIPLGYSLPSWSASASRSGVNFEIDWTTSGSLQSLSYTIPRRCKGNPPAAGFTCADGIWVSTSSVSTTQTVIISGPTVVVGNLTTPSVTFEGIGFTLNVSECILGLGEIFVTLTTDEFESLKSTKTITTTLITSTCSSGIEGASDVSLITNTQTKRRSCEKLSSRLNSNGSNMVAVFTLSRSSCNTWWIVVVAVVGGVILISAVLAIIFTTVPAARACIRPYTRRQHTKTNSV